MALLKEKEDNPLDIDGNNFDSELYFEKLLKCGTLRQIMDKEAEIITQSQSLQSEMQTLVYENYNKFISATETVSRMRSDFKTMQEEMSKLSENMNKITSLNAQISLNLKDSGDNISRLCNTRQLLDKLQFLFILPSQLNKAISEERYIDAVSDYTHAQRVLQKYGNQPSFQNIQSECSKIIEDLKQMLKNKMLSPETTAGELVECVGLLCQLQETSSSLKDIFLSCAENKLEKHVHILTSCIETSDILEWVEKCNNSLLADMGIVITCYNDIFECEKLPEFGDKVLSQVFGLFDAVIEQPANSGTDILIRGLDKFFKKLQAMNSIIPSETMASKAMDVVLRCINYKSKSQLTSINTQLKDSITKLRQSLVSKTENVDLREMLNSLQMQLIQKLQNSLFDLTAFLQSNLSFSLKPWCAKAVGDACWNIISGVMTELSNLVQKFSTSHTSNNIPHELLLILAKLSTEMQDNGVNTLNTYVTKLFEESAPGHNLEKNDINDVKKLLLNAAQSALDAVVLHTGQIAAQMLRISVMTRDWLRAPEPRGPRAVCRRVVETLISADNAASQLFPTAIKPSSDSSRRTIWSNATSPFSPINRLFSERIEVFAAVKADRGDIANGTIKVALKALVECIRLRTFGRHGLQQIQVDLHFLQQRLSCMSNDERLLNALLEDALASAQLRCVDPQLMEPSIVDIICERG